MMNETNGRPEWRTSTLQKTQRRIILFLAIGLVAIMNACSIYTGEVVTFGPEVESDLGPAGGIVARIAAGEHVRIVCFGDSLTFGLNAVNNYPQILEEEIELVFGNTRVEFINLGVPGETTWEALARIQDVLEVNPDLVLLMYGANDWGQGGNPQNTFESCTAMVRELKDAGVSVVTMTGPPHVIDNNADILPFYRAAYEVAIAEGVSFINIHSEFLDLFPTHEKTIYELISMFPDELHLSDYTIMAEIIMGTLRAQLG